MISQAAIAVFQGILHKHNVVVPVDWNRLRITEHIVTEAMDGEMPLSDAILDSCFPRSDTAIEYAHYTSFATLQGLVNSGEWRLYWVYKRIKEHEFATFSKDHGLDGYFDTDANSGNPVYVDFCRDLFYTSVTRYPSSNENGMWAAFSDGGQGVRLIFRIQPVLQRCHFRPVRYKDPRFQTIIQELFDAVQTQLKRRLVLRGISRIGAFYLPACFGGEEESRLLVKRFYLPAGMPNPWSIVRSDGADEYLPIPLNSNNDFCRIDLIRVDAGPRASRNAIDQELQKNSLFHNVAR